MFSGLPVCFFAYLRVTIDVLLSSRAICEIPVPVESENSSGFFYLRIDGMQLSLMPDRGSVLRGGKDLSPAPDVQTSPHLSSTPPCPHFSRGRGQSWRYPI